MNPSIGAVVIGRNEGDRLKACLEALKTNLDKLVYVDSGSTDDSVALARSMDIETVDLDLTSPFTAARARNVGFEALTTRWPKLNFVQFVDGDCELRTDWIATAARHLESQKTTAIVCGRLRERYPERSAYNRLCDLEWDTPIGDVRSCGGIFLARADAFRNVAGFSEDMIAGEEPDLCFRLRQQGWTVTRIDAEMALHDANMHHISQWWQRSKRSGYASMEASRRRGNLEPQLKRRVWSNVLWGIPIAWPLWPILWARLYRHKGALYATHIVAGKVPHLLGILSYWSRKLRGSKPRLIEHK